MGKRLCRCGCGAEVGPKARFVRGHNWRAQRRAEQIPEEKVCVGCGSTFTRVEVGQRTEHWLQRRYCSNGCRKKASGGLFYCPGCATWKAPSAFYRDRTKAKGVQGYCKVCQDGRRKPNTDAQNFKHNLRAGYGITPEEYEALLDTQGGVCAICGRTETATNYRTGGTLRLSVDHCAETGKVRGLLCGACNKGIGGLKHDPEILNAALAYLART